VCCVRGNFEVTSCTLCVCVNVHAYVCLQSVFFQVGTCTGNNLKFTWQKCADLPIKALAYL